MYAETATSHMDVTFRRIWNVTATKLRINYDVVDSSCAVALCMINRIITIKNALIFLGKDRETEH